MIEVELDKISINPHQPRRHFADEELMELSSSIQSVGLIHPPVVRAISGDRYEIISGERRFRAAKLANLKKIPVLVRTTDTYYSAQAALIENIQRVDLNPLEVALALESLMNQFDFTQEKLAQRIGKKRSTVANYLRLLTLPKQIQEAISSGTISMGHAKVILSLEGEKLKNQLFQEIVEGDFSVRQTEQRAAKLQRGPTENHNEKDVHLEQLAQKLQEMLGTKVTVQGTARRGKISIDYYSLDDLNRLIDKLNIET